LLIYNGRGGGSGVRVPRRPRRPPNADAVRAPLPEEPTPVYAASHTEPPAYAIPG